jgi:hypothetical protein
MHQVEARFVRDGGLLGSLPRLRGGILSARCLFMIHLGAIRPKKQEGKTHMRYLSILLLVAGSIMGPGYYVYSVYFSGSSRGKVIVYSQDIEKFNTGSVRLYSTSNSKWNTPIKLSVNPDMNPVSLIVEATYLRPLISTRQHRLNYNAILKNKNRTVWNESLSIKPSKRNKVDNSMFIASTPTGYYHKKLLTFEASETGEYFFDLRRDGASKTKVKKITLDIRQNVIQPNLYVATTGMILFMISIASLLFLRLGPANTHQMRPVAPEKAPIKTHPKGTSCRL